MTWRTCLELKFWAVDLIQKLQRKQAAWISKQETAWNALSRWEQFQRDTLLPVAAVALATDTSTSLHASVSRQWRHPLVQIEEILTKSFWSHFPTWNLLSFDGILHMGSSLLAALEERLAKSSTLVWRMVLATPFRSPFLDCTTAYLIRLFDFQMNFCSRCTLCPRVYTDIPLSIVPRCI